MAQALLLFSSDTWLSTLHMGRVLGGFQEQVMRRLAGWILRRKPDGRWTYTLAATEREEAGFQIMEEYIRQR